MVSGPTWTVPLSARATSESSVVVCPVRAGLPAPRSSAVEPDTATPRVSRPASCSARTAASITMPFPAPAGPTSTTARSGPVSVRSASCCSRVRGAPIRSATSRAAFRRPVSPTSRPAGRARVAARRSIACSCARTFKVVIRPPTSVRICRSPSMSLMTVSAMSGAISPAVCSSATARSSGAVKIACCSVRVSSMRSCTPRSAAGGAGCARRPSVSAGPNSEGSAVSRHARARSPRVAGFFARRFSNARPRSSPSRGARP